jgi:multisubunit Na+/H+ antiporter MnhB subunit
VSLALDAALCALALGAALATVAGRGLFRAIVFFVVYGVLLAITWVRLGAVDVALAEAAIGAGLTGVLFLGAYGRLARAGIPGDPPSVPAWPAAVAGAGLAGALCWAWLSLPAQPEAAVAAPLAEALPRAGVGNPVTAVLLNFRAWDTLLESVVLLAALVGLWTLTREAAWGGRVGLPQHVRAGGVLAGFGRALPPVGLLVGVYVVHAGADAPGGAFQGGTVLAAVGLAAVLAGAMRRPRMGAPGWRAALVAGPAVFLAAGLAGAALGHGFLTLPEAVAGTAILVIEVALAASIAVTLAFLVLGPPEGPPPGGPSERMSEHPGQA